ncbi:S-type pyocin domain-containing protein [Pseudomonas capsici]|nr:S-type pyocin domain-containing protein [Pseudomonas capsici]MCV4341889.1 S-type pyocin domain-containing protein [Pseudomonas capsici]
MYHTLLDWEKSFQTSLALLDSALGQELNVARGGIVQDTNTIEGIQRELILRGQLMEKKRAEIQQVSSEADRFYGTDPLLLSHKQQMDVVIRLMNGHPRPRELHWFAQTSHEAAYKRRFAQESFGKLAGQSAALRARLAELQRQAAEAAAEQAQAEAAARAAAEQAQAEAAARVAAEQTQAEAAARATAEQAQAEAAARVTAEQAQREAERLQKERRPDQVASNIFQIHGATTAAGAQLITMAGRILAAEGAALTLQASIRASIAALSELAAGAASGLLVGVSALIYPSELGNGELPNRYALTLPLTDLTASPITEINHGPINISVRIGFKPASSGHTEVIVIPADGVHVSRSVRVIAAVYDSAQNVYSVSTPDIPSKTMIWTPIADPGNSSTVLPVDTPQVSVYSGVTLMPVTGRMDTYPELDDVEIDDYVFIFPSDSGLPALYVVFQSPRNMPGVVRGEGQTVSGSWLGPLAEGEGAPIPKQIAEQLRGKQFSDFSRFREAFWKLVADDELLVSQFSSENKVLMQKGYAPYTPKRQSVGERKVFEIHHIDFISNGGAVYDLDNMRILTPARHIKLHSEVKHG